MRKTAVAITLIMALLITVGGTQFTSLSSANFFPDPGPDLPRIYIRSDGAVEPATAPIERTGNLYKLTDNITLYTIEIQCDNIVLDGSDYLIQGNGSWLGYGAGNNGVIVAGRSNVTITGLNIAQCYAGIRISRSSYISVVDNSFINGTNMGVAVQDSTLVLIEANDFTDLLTDLHVPAVGLNGSRNTIRNNNITGSTYGIEIEGSSNVISDNRIETMLPIMLDKADSNTIARNNITGPASSPRLPDQNYKGNEGIALFSKCSNNMIFGNNLTGFLNQAIRITDGSNNIVYGNYMTKNQFAIAIGGFGNPGNNTFYGNTFAADSCKIQIDDEYDIAWDNGTIGNYWNDYNGTDLNGDGIGDSPYMINAFKWDQGADGFVSFVSGQDNYPLMTPYDIEHNAAVLPQPEPFPTLPVAAVSVAVAVVVAVGVLVYLRKRRREDDLVKIS